MVEILEKILTPSCFSFPLRSFRGVPEPSQKSPDPGTLLTTKNTHTPRKIKILQIPYLKQLVNEKLMCSDVLQSADPSRGRLYGESFTNCPRFICESRFIIMLL